jgi:hypothetical protein
MTGRGLDHAGLSGMVQAVQLHVYSKEYIWVLPARPWRVDELLDLGLSGSAEVNSCAPLFEVATPVLLALSFVTNYYYPPQAHLKATTAAKVEQARRQMGMSGPEAALFVQVGEAIFGW